MNASTDCESERAGLIGKGERGMERGNLKSVIMGEREGVPASDRERERVRERKRE